MLKQAITIIPSWHNLTTWLYLITLHNDPKNHFSKMRHYLNHRAGLIKELILIKTMNPEYMYWNMDATMDY
jgi:hypothetical protein